MENTNKSILTDKSLAYMTTVSNMAKIIAILMMLKIGFRFYYLYKFYEYYSTTSSGSGLRYFGNSLSYILLSVISTIFLILFSSKIDQAKRSNQIEDWNSAFAFFRNYLMVSIIISISWMFFAFLQYFL